MANSKLPHERLRVWADSLEKLLDDMRGYAYGGVSCVEDDMIAFADRLTALIDRGEE